MKNILINVIDFYQKNKGPWHGSCRFIPTCSEYAKKAIIRYGAFRGSLMAIKRIIRCNPLGGKGYDPVKEKKK